MTATPQHTQTLRKTYTCRCPLTSWEHTQSDNIPTPYPRGETQRRCDMKQDRQTPGHMMQQMTAKLFVGVCVQVFLETGCVPLFLA